VVSVSAHRSQVATALVMVGKNGVIDLQGSSAGLKVSMFSMGYLTDS
jgi:hypothetical protein